MYLVALIFTCRTDLGHSYDLAVSREGHTLDVAGKDRMGEEGYLGMDGWMDGGIILLLQESCLGKLSCY